jgi:ribosomal protein L9
VNPGEVDDKKATRMGYLCNLMTKSFAYKEMEFCIEKIEQQLKKLEKTADETHENS